VGIVFSLFFNLHHSSLTSRACDPLGRPRREVVADPRGAAPPQRQAVFSDNPGAPLGLLLLAHPYVLLLVTVAAVAAVVVVVVPTRGATV
jgi:hypothetical protein